MGKMIAVFQTQAEAEAAMNELNRLNLEDVEMGVFHGPSQGGPQGADTIPATGFAGIPGPIRPTGAGPAFIPFTGIDLDLDENDDAEYLQRMYEGGATLVRIDAPDSQDLEIRRILSINGGRFSREG